MAPASESYASTNSITNFRFTFVADADSLNDDTEDSSVSVADSTGTEVPVEMIPEFGTFVVPVFVVVGLFAISRKKRKLRKHDS